MIEMPLMKLSARFARPSSFGLFLVIIVVVIEWGVFIFVDVSIYCVLFFTN